MDFANLTSFFIPVINVLNHQQIAKQHICQILTININKIKIN